MASLTDDFFNVILAVEGGYQEHPKDNGNYACEQLLGTNMGVSAVAYSMWVGRCPTKTEIKNLTQQTAFNFYSWYFDKYNLFKIQNQKFAELLMNNTMGNPTGACKVEQRALNKLGYSLVVDGNRGQNTINALNDGWEKHGPVLYNLIRTDWINFLEGLNLPHFLPTWMNRMNNHFPELDESELDESGNDKSNNQVVFGIIGVFILFLLSKK
jgi:lysozyme family protein